MSDAYYTPDNVADLMTDAVHRIIGARWREMYCVLEPHAGGGALVRAAKRQWPELWVVAYDIDPKARGLAEADVGVVCDWLSVPSGDRDRIILMNPPFSRAAECGLRHVEHALNDAGPDGVVCALLPLSFLSAKKRAPLLARCPPTQVTVLHERPRFAAQGDLDHGHGIAIPLAIFVWAEGVRPMPLRWAPCA